MHEPAVIWPYIVRPRASSLRNSSHVAQCGTRFAFAISTRGAFSCVLNTPTGLPHCTSSVSALPRRGDDGVEALPVARRFADAAVDDELLRPLRDFGVEIVHQHAQRGLLLPSLAGELRAARRVDDAAWVEGGDHGLILCPWPPRSRSARRRSMRGSSGCIRRRSARSITRRRSSC